jgi:hypothetical protein
MRIFKRGWNIAATLLLTRPAWASEPWLVTLFGIVFGAVLAIVTLELLRRYI